MKTATPYYFVTVKCNEIYALYSWVPATTMFTSQDLPEKPFFHPKLLQQDGSGTIA